MSTYHSQVPPKLQGARLDKAITQMLPNTSRSRIQKAIKSGTVRINNTIISDSDYKVKENDTVEIVLIEEIPVELKEANIPLEIIFEDDCLMVINKPVGLTVHPGAGNHQDTLVNALIYHSKFLSDLGGHFRPGIVHRLDKDTSGLMIVAKNNEAHFKLAAQIEQRAIIRKYKALVWGVANPTRGIIQNNIGRDKILRQKMTVLKSGGKNAITNYQTEEIFLNGLISLVECQLNTGRTHQIRVHMSHIGHSIIGDQTYGSNARKIKALSPELQKSLCELKRQALHSYYLAFTHPLNNKLFKFKIDLPSDIVEVINIIKRHLK